ncbi:hypothetical protein FAUST_2866 [Fusarium austroamericanum]|uniref:Uncharacterized protein n=1 Tax=Fusarium austroamericanum TaxID=282268 RepID=A0AAN6HI57_FUSAU|nr:hypothetical protein FAUST_2866 [Fusarium austroamericanum]
MKLSIKKPITSLKKWYRTTGEKTINKAQTFPIENSHDQDAFNEVDKISDGVESLHDSEDESANTSANTSASISDEVESLHASDDENPYPESPIIYNGGQYFDAEDYFYHDNGKYFEKALRPEKKPKPPQPKIDAYLLNELHIAMHGHKDPEVIQMENYVKAINEQDDAPLKPARP